MRLSIALATAMLGAVLAGPAMAEEAIVIESNADGIKEGDLVPDGATLVVPDGKAVTLITNSGQTIALKGPFTGPTQGNGAGQGESQVVAVLSGLFERNQVGGQLGVSRSIDLPLAVDTYELGSSGQICFYDPASAKISPQPPMRAQEVVNLLSATGTASATVRVPARGSVPWPSELVLKNGAKFLVQKEGERTAKMITIRLMDSRAETDLDRVLEMAGAGCDQQALRLLKEIKAES